MKKIDICVGTDRDRNIRVRLSLMYLDDDTGDLITERYHSANLSPGDDPSALRKAVEDHIASPDGGILGAPWPKIPDVEWQEVLDYVKVAHTPERIAAQRARVAANEATMQPTPAKVRQP